MIPVSVTYSDSKPAIIIIDGGENVDFLLFQSTNRLLARFQGESRLIETENHYPMGGNGLMLIPMASYYVCPKCKTHTGSMQLSEEKHKPTEAQLRNHPAPTEILICPCGDRHTWFDLEEISRELSAAESSTQPPC